MFVIKRRHSSIYNSSSTFNIRVYIYKWKKRRAFYNKQTPTQEYRHRTHVQKELCGTSVFGACWWFCWYFFLALPFFSFHIWHIMCIYWLLHAFRVLCILKNSNGMHTSRRITHTRAHTLQPHTVYIRSV